jgi:hypothetical protein
MMMKVRKRIKRLKRAMRRISIKIKKLGLLERRLAQERKMGLPKRKEMKKRTRKMIRILENIWMKKKCLMLLSIAS